MCRSFKNYFSLTTSIQYWCCRLRLCLPWAFLPDCASAVSAAPAQSIGLMRSISIWSQPESYLSLTLTQIRISIWKANRYSSKVVLVSSGAASSGVASCSWSPVITGEAGSSWVFLLLPPFSADVTGSGLQQKVSLFLLFFSQRRETGLSLMGRWQVFPRECHYIFPLQRYFMPQGLHFNILELLNSVSSLSLREERQDLAKCLDSKYLLGVSLHTFPPEILCASRHQPEGSHLLFKRLGWVRLCWLLNPT